MPALRSAALTIVALCLLSSPGVALGKEQGAPGPSNPGRTEYRSNRVLTRVIIFGSIGAIAGALGSLRKRSAADALNTDDERSSQ